MPLFKVTYFTRYKTFGCSFALYRTIGNYANMEPAAKDMRSAIGALLGAGVEMPYYRISDEAIKRDSLYQDNPAIVIDAGGSGSAPSGWNQIKAAMGGAPDYGGVAVLVDLLVDAVSKGRIFLRLIPDDLIIYPGGVSSDPGWDKAFQRFSFLLLANAWQVRATASNAVNPEHMIIGFSINPMDASDLEVTTVDNHGFVKGDTVRIGNVQGGSGINGVYIIALTPGSATTFKVRLPAPAALPAVPNGYARKIQVIPQSIQSAKVKGVTGRKPGRPFGSSVGRRSAAKKP